MIKKLAVEIFVKNNNDSDNHFTASNGWLQKFIKRNKLKLSTLYGENESKIEDRNSHQDRINEIISLLKDVDCSKIFNCDETASFYNLRPSRSYLFQNEPYQCKGLQKDKSRVTVVLSCNSNGTIKIPITIIGKSKTPHCFRGKGRSFNYLNQSNGWMDSELFLQWLESIFFKHVRKTIPIENTICLIVDNFKAHNNIPDHILSKLNIIVIYLPPNCTGFYQPLDHSHKGHYPTLLEQINFENINVLNLNQTKKHHEQYLQIKKKNMVETYCRILSSDDKRKISKSSLIVEINKWLEIDSDSFMVGIEDIGFL